MQNSPLESSRVVVALVALNSISKPLNVSPEKSQILSCDTVVQMGDMSSNINNNDNVTFRRYHVTLIAKTEKQL